MKHLIHLPNPEWMYDNVLMLEVAMQAYTNKDDVKILVCDSTVSICPANPKAEKIVCKWCKYNRKKLLNQLSKDIDILYYHDFYLDENKTTIELLEFNYNSIETIKKLKYKNLNIGYGALSTYISLTRNLDPVLNIDFRKYFDLYLRAECIIIEILNNICDQIKPNIVSLYNGRYFDTRPIYEYFKYIGNPIKCYENAKGETFNKRRIVSYENCLPSNISGIYNVLIKKTWDEVDFDEEKKEKIGVLFFENRRNTKFAGGSSFTKNQTTGLLPEGFNKSKRNIAIYISSEDEFASVSDEYISKLFPSQDIGVSIIMEEFKDDTRFHFYMRIHPNLKNVRYKYHLALHDYISRYSNLTVIKASDEVDTYSLLDNVEKVIVFGSTVGVEACFWGKPVVLLYSAFYNYLDVCYKPKNIEEAFNLIREKNLLPKSKKDAIKYGFSQMYMPDENFRFFDHNSKFVKIPIVKKKILLLKFRPVKYSLLIIFIIKKILLILKKMKLYRSMEIPIDEN